MPRKKSDYVEKRSPKVHAEKRRQAGETQIEVRTVVAEEVEVLEHLTALDSRQCKVLSMLLAGHLITECAREARVSTVTIYKWLAEPDFSSALAIEKSRSMSLIRNRLTELTFKALQNYEMLMDSETESIRLAASRDVINYQLKQDEKWGLEEKLKELEQKLKIEGST